MNKITSLVLVFMFLGTAKAQDIKSISLKEAQDYAVENSYMSKTSALNIKKADQKVKETTAIGLPQISAEGNFQNFLEIPTTLIPADAFPTFPGMPEPEPGTFSETQFGTNYNITGGVKVSQLLFDGSYIVGLRAAKTYKQIAANADVKTKVEIRDAITNAYGMVLVAKENQRILKKNIANLQKTLNETTELYNNGFAEEQDVDQLKLTLQNLKNKEVTVERQIEMSKNLLKFQMGMPIEDKVSLSDKLDDLISDNSEDFLTKEFNPNGHIDYLMAETNLKSNELLMKNSQTGYLPSLAAFYNYQRSFMDNKLDFSGKTWFPTSLWGLTLNIPIFSSTMRYQKVQQSKIDVEIAQLEKDQTEQNLKIQALNAKTDYASALDTYNNEKENLELASKIKSNTEVKFKEGVASSMELTQAQNQELSTQGNYINSLFSLISAKSALDIALGKN